MLLADFEIYLSNHYALLNQPGLSSRLAAPRSTVINGSSALAAWLWIARATNSFPVPFSPRTNTLASVVLAFEVHRNNSVLEKSPKVLYFVVPGSFLDGANALNGFH
jgi:hypothetical protein